MVDKAFQAERRKQAIALRLAGYTWEQIANQVGYGSKQAAQKDVSKALANESETGDENLSLARMDVLYRKAWPKALKGDIPAINLCLCIEQTRRKIREANHVTAVQSDPEVPKCQSSR